LRGIGISILIIGRALRRLKRPRKDATAFWRQLLVYLGCVLGVIVGPFLPAALGGTPPSLAAVFGGANHLFWSAVIGLALFPAIYKLVFDPEKPLIVQIAFGLVAGFLAQKIVPSVIEIVAKGVGVS
jgi:hypothetical protein